MGFFGPQYPCLRQVIVNLKSNRDLALRGVLWARQGAYLVLRNVEQLRVKGEPVALVGEVVIDAANVEFVQVLDEADR